MLLQIQTPKHMLSVIHHHIVLLCCHLDVGQHGWDVVLLFECDDQIRIMNNFGMG